MGKRSRALWLFSVPRDMLLRNSSVSSTADGSRQVACSKSSERMRGAAALSNSSLVRRPASNLQTTPPQNSKRERKEAITGEGLKACIRRDYTVTSALPPPPPTFQGPSRQRRPDFFPTAQSWTPLPQTTPRLRARGKGGRFGPSASQQPARHFPLLSVLTDSSALYAK